MVAAGICMLMHSCTMGISLYFNTCIDSSYLTVLAVFMLRLD